MSEPPGSGLGAGPLAGAGLLLVGAVTGVASLAVHDKSWPWFLLAVAAPLVTAVALRPGWARVGFGLGWTAIVIVALLGRPEGDFVVAATGRGYSLLGLTLGLVVLVLVTVPVARRA